MSEVPLYCTEMCSGFEVGLYVRLIDLVHHSTLGLRVIIISRREPLHRDASRST